MIKSMSDKLYEKLSLTERRQLTIAALARKDLLEVEKLRRTCPMKKYLMGDDAFFGTMNKLNNIIAWYIDVCQYLYNKIVLHEAYRFSAESSALLLKAGFNLAENCMNAPLMKDKITDELEQYVNKFTEAKNLYIQLINDNTAVLKAVHQAFLNFCKTTNFNADHLMQWASLSDHCRDIEKYLQSSIETSSKYMQLFEKKIITMWNA